MIWFEFVYFPHSLRTDLLTDDDWQQVESDLLINPRAGKVMVGTGGARKLRIRLQGRGKRGGARLVYVYIERHERIYFLVTYAKNEQDDLTPDDAAVTRRLIHMLEQGG